MMEPGGAQSVTSFWNALETLDTKKDIINPSSREGIKEGSSIDRLIRKLSKELELNLDSYEPIISKNLVKGKLDLIGDYVDLSTDKISNLGMIYHLVDEGLKHDMYGDTYYKPTQSHDEIAFDIEKEGYNIRGFIDKLFIYKKDGKVLIRDFKTSKKSFAGKDLEDNMQALIYALAVKDMYPDSIKDDICVEFVFLRLMGRKGDVLRYMVGENELLGFEEFLKQVQTKWKTIPLKTPRTASPNTKATLPTVPFRERCCAEGPKEKVN